MTDQNKKELLTVLLPPQESRRLDGYCDSPALSRAVIASELARRVLNQRLADLVRSKIEEHRVKCDALSETPLERDREAERCSVEFS